MRPSFRFSLVAATVATVLGVQAIPVPSGAPDTVEDVVAAVAAVAPTEVLSADITTVSTGVTASFEDGSETHLPADPADAVEVTSPEGDVVLSFSLPAASTIAYQAGVAQNSKPKRCVQVTATQPMIIPGLYWWVDTYAGGACR